MQEDDKNGNPITCLQKITYKLAEGPPLSSFFKCTDNLLGVYLLKSLHTSQS